MTKSIGKDAFLFFACMAILSAFAPIIPWSEAGTITVEARDDAAIAAAVTRAEPGDEVFLPAGTYELREGIHPASQIRLRGAGQGQTILLFAGDAPGAMIDLSDCRDVEVCHLSLDGDGNANAVQGVFAHRARSLNIHHLTIENLVEREGFGPHGIHFTGDNPSQDNGVTGSIISDCLLENIGVGAAFGGGIRLSWGSSRNEVLRNEIRDTGRGGIFGDNGSDDLIIRGNAVSGSGGEGLGIEVWGGCERAVVEDNRIDHWLSFGGCDFGAARRNVIGDDSGVYKFCGIEVIGSYCAITDNAVEGGQRIGLSVSDDSAKNYVFWARNRVRDCNQWGAQFQGEDTGLACHYLYRCRFLSMPVGQGPVWYPGDEGHGFRMNGNARGLTFEECEFAGNGRLGVQVTGTDVDALSFVRCTIRDNRGAAVAGLRDYAALEWVDCRVFGNGDDALPPSRGFDQESPGASFAAPDSAAAGESVAFVNTSRTGADEAVAVLWDFGDGPPSAEGSSRHVYDHPGTYRVTLVVWDRSGRGARAEKEVRITGARREPYRSY